LWSRTEAATKVTGVGLSVTLSSLDVSGPQLRVGPDGPDLPRVELRDLDAPGRLVAALASTVAIDRIVLERGY
jgi:phosphopantetheinyl transferase